MIGVRSLPAGRRVQCEAGDHEQRDRSGDQSDDREDLGVVVIVAGVPVRPAR